MIAERAEALGITLAVAPFPREGEQSRAHVMGLESSGPSHAREVEPGSASEANSAQSCVGIESASGANSGQRVGGYQPCGAHARQTGQPCRAEGSGVGGRCKQHGGLSLDSDRRRPFVVLVTPSGCVLYPRCPSRGHRMPRWPQRVRPWIGIRLVASERVTMGLLYRSEGHSFLAELRARGVRVIDEGPGSRLRRRVRFDASGAMTERAFRLQQATKRGER